MRRVLFAAHTRDVNIFIWSSRKSVDHETNDRVKVHGDGTRADGRRSRSGAHLSEIVGSRDRRPAPSIFGSLSNVVDNQAGYLARPTTKAPETQIYFMTDGLTRGPDKDVHVPSVGSQKYPSRGVDVIYL